MKHILKKIFSPFLFSVVNKRTYVGLRHTSLIGYIKYNIRFKLAGHGIFLTNNEKRLASLKDKYKGQRCFIIGNGPSLNKIDLLE
jgi:hypothetical protein